MLMDVKLKLMGYLSLVLMCLSMGCKDNEVSNKAHEVNLQVNEKSFIATVKRPSFLSECHSKDSLLQPGQLFYVYQGTDLECHTADGRSGLIHFDTLNFVKLDLKHIYLTLEYESLNDTMELYSSTMKHYNTDWNLLVDRAEKVSYSAMDSVITFGLDLLDNGGVDTEIYLSKVYVLLPRWNDSRIAKYLEQGSVHRINAFKEVFNAIMGDDKEANEYYSIFYPKTCEILKQRSAVVLDGSKD
jgi:hypothetical protein